MIRAKNERKSVFHHHSAVSVVERQAHVSGLTCGTQLAWLTVESLDELSVVSTLFMISKGSRWIRTTSHGRM